MPSLEEDPRGSVANSPLFENEDYQGNVGLDWLKHMMKSTRKWRVELCGELPRK